MSSNQDLIATGTIKAILSMFKWQINDFCKCCKHVGDFLVSPKFTAATNVQWYLNLFPRGIAEAHKDYLSLYLYCTEEVTAACTFKIINNRQEVMFSATTKEYNYGKISSGYGYERFVSTNFIKNPGNHVLSNRSLTIICEILYMHRYVVKETKLVKEIDDSEDDLLSRLKVLDIYEDLLKDEKFSDVCLISEEGKTLKVHKCILAKNSSVFATMFNTEMKEKQENTVEIADIKYDVLVEMIRFVYAGKVNNFDTLAGELALAADKYALDELKSTCERRMRKNLCLENVVDCLKFADKLHMSELKEKAIDFIVEKASDVTEKPEFQTLPSDIVCKVCSALAKKLRSA